MHLDDGEVDLTSHIHVPALNVQSHVPYDVLSNSYETRSGCLISLVFRHREE